MAASGKPPGLGDVSSWISLVLGGEAAFVRLAVVYGVAIALLGLATPISVQLLINSVANLALPAPLFTLSALLLALLLFAVALSALRLQLMALFERRAFARVVAEITLRAVHAQNPFFTDTRREALFNRFFDLIVVQKSVPSLLVGGFTIVLQAVVGLVVTSFYHPFFLAFNFTLALLIFAIFQIWARPALRSAIGVSHAKHDTAAWIETVGGSNGFYKSSRHQSFAMTRSEAMIGRYVGAHRRHFRFYFAQTLALLVLYALASAALLALGGWLIIQGQLSIGQLVAAELILSGVFYGLSSLGVYLDTFYDLSASLEELTLLYSIPQEPHEPRSGRAPANGALRFREVEQGDLRFNFEVEPGEQLTAMAEPGVDHGLATLLKRHVQPRRGIVMVGGDDIEAFDMFQLRSDVMVFERPTIVEMTIREYLNLAGGAAGGAGGGVMDMLELTGAASRIARLPDGLDTALSSSGYPLSTGDMMALKLAMALIAAPKVLMLSPMFDLLPPERLRAAFAKLRESGTTVLRVTRRPDNIAGDGFLWLGAREQHRLATPAALRAAAQEPEERDVVPA